MHVYKIFLIFVSNSFDTLIEICRFKKCDLIPQIPSPSLSCDRSKADVCGCNFPPKCPTMESLFFSRHIPESFLHLETRQRNEKDLLRDSTNEW